MATRKLKALARQYLEVRAAQEQEHTNLALDHQRTEAHDALMLQMDHEGIPYASREEAAEIARGIVAGTYKRPAAKRKKRPSKAQRAERAGQIRLL